ncbi:MAG: zinc-dependent metalloprotease [Candidatus Krumholzibacteriia bacterium]
MIQGRRSSAGRRRVTSWICSAWWLPFCLGLAAPARASDPLPGIADKTAGLQMRSGLLDIHLDPQHGRVWLRLPAPPEGSDEIGRYLYFEGLVTGLGSNPVGLDRSQLGATRVIALRRLGGRVLVEQLNTRYRALSERPAERRAAEQSFATSVLWAGELGAVDSDGSMLVDFTSFLVRDAHRVAAALEASGQGSWSLDDARSAVDLGACVAFPENLEFESLLTFAGSEPGGEVRATSPAPESISLVLHHSILRLPDPGYEPRRFDPRIGCSAMEFADYASPLDEPLEKRWILRHRLVKVDPHAERSRVEEPIVYYVDRGAPEPVRNALVEGASWWAEAFEAAGFIDAFRVELLPEGVHPLDARYNVVNWVHRATRGWSYGWGVVDPRTGEFVKGHVLLGSLRVRQDRLLFEGLAGTEHTGSGRPDDPIEMALARIRQLAAHEVGHTLGVAHNFAASTYGRASVMDYPAPLVKITPAGDLDFSEAYAVGIGAWDVLAIRYAYTQFAPGADEQAALEEIVRDGLQRDLHFVSDADARPSGAAQPLGNLWDNGRRAEEALAHTLEVRRIALARFGERNIAPGRPLALLEEVLAPVYFMHRYELDAAAKVVGGLDYRYAVRGDGQPGMRAIDARRQRRALAVILECMSPEVLDLPESVLGLLLPRPYGYDRNRELLHSSTLPAFDALGVAATAADVAVRRLLQRERCARLVDQHRRDPRLPGLEEVLQGVGAAAFDAGASRRARHAEIQRGVQQVVVDALIDLASSPSTPPHVRSRLEWQLESLRRDLSHRRSRDEVEQAHRALLVAQLGRHLDRLDDAEPLAGASDPPPGSPIGSTVPPRLSGCSWGP